MSMLLSLNSWQLLYLFFIIHVTTLPPTTTPFTRFLPKQRPDSGRLTYTGGLCMDCLNAVICHFSLYNSATMHLLCFLVKVCGCPGACSLRAGSLSFLLWNFWTALFISCDLQDPRKVRKCNIQHSEHQKECCCLWQCLLTKLFYQKLGNGPRVGKCPGPRQHKICKCPTPGTDKAGISAVAWKGHWAQLELTDALDAANCTFLKLLMNNQ